VSDDALRRRRARRQRLHRPPGGPVDIVRALLAVQAQDARVASLALRARGTGFGASDVDAALGEELVIAWLMRGTLHLVAREDHPWLLALTAPARVTANRRRLAQEGVAPDDADRAVALIGRALDDDGPLTRPQLAERLGAAGIRTAGQAMPHLLMRAALDGATVLGAGGRFQRAEPAPAVDRDAALAELARRWLAAHGPGSDRDLAAWAGLPLRDARAGLRAAGEPPEPADAAAPVPPRLLGAFDPYLLGWRDRTFAVAPEHARRVHPGGGMLRAVATADGLVVGTWTAPGGEIAIERFGDDATDFAGEIADVARFLSA
jgi:DNA glycosylase AlkZ-like